MHFQIQYGGVSHPPLVVIWYTLGIIYLVVLVAIDFGPV